MRTPEQALAYARRFTTCRVGMCLWHVQDWFGSPHKYPDAISQANAVRLYQGTPPPGVPVFYRGGKHGHVAISTGNGNIRSTDCPSDGRVGETDLNWPQRRWGHVYIGWSKNIGGVDIPGIGSGGSSSGAITKNIYSDKLGYGEPTNGDESSDTVKELQRRLNGISLVGGTTLPITGRYGSLTDAEVRKWQQQKCGDTPDQPDRSFLGPAQRARMFPASEGYVIHDKGLPKIASRPVEPEAPAPQPPVSGVPACPPADQFKPGVSNPAFTWMGQRFLVWLSPQEIAHEGTAYEPGPRFSTYDEENIRKCQSRMGDVADPPGSAFLGPKQWARLAAAPPDGGGGGTDAGSGSGDPDPGPGGGVADAPPAPGLMYPGAVWAPIKKQDGTYVGTLRPFKDGGAKIVLHTTQTKQMTPVNWANQNGRGLPHFTLDVKTNECWQHLPLDGAAWTMKGPDDGPSPNSDGGLTIQIEMVGYAEDTPRWDLAKYWRVRDLIVWLNENLYIPIKFPFPFGGQGEDVRVDWVSWRAASGIVGHGHAPWNDHWDPGAINVDQLRPQLPEPPEPPESLPDWLWKFIQSNWAPIVIVGSVVLLVLAVLFGGT